MNEDEILENEIEENAEDTMGVDVEEKRPPEPTQFPDGDYSGGYDPSQYELPKEWEAFAEYHRINSEYDEEGQQAALKEYESASSMANASMICGIIGVAGMVIGCCGLGMIGGILCIVAIVLSAKGKINGALLGKAKAGRILGIVGLVMYALSVLYGIAMVFGPIIIDWIEDIF